MNTLLSLLINTLSLLAIAYLLQGIHIQSFWSALVMAIVLAVVNTVIRPLALLITIPVNILTLGLFTFVVNAAMLKLAGAVVKGVRIDSWGTAIVGAILLSVISGVLDWII
jgi:putative membrane protein